MSSAVGDQRQLELERLPVGVEDDVIVGAIHREPHREREAVRRVAPVRLAELDAVPGDVLLEEQLIQRHPLLLVLDVSQYPPSVEHAHEPVHVGSLREQRPVEPVGLVVLTIGVVVAALCAPHLVTHEHHRHPRGQHGHGEEVLHLSRPQPVDVGIFGRPFHSTVPASVVVGAVAIVLAVRLVVFPVVGNEVVQGEPVVTRHEVDALLGLALLVAVERRAADQAIGKPLDRAFLAAEEAADIVAEASVPFLPAVADEGAYLVQAGGIPRLGDELRPRQHRVRLDIPQHRRVRHHVARLVQLQDRCEIEPEAIHVHHVDPVAQTVHDHPPHDGMIAVERVPGSAVVRVTRPIRLENVVGRVVQSAEAQRRARVIAFGGMVEHDVENDLEARSVQRLDHIAKLVDGTERIST